MQLGNLTDTRVRPRTTEKYRKAVGVFLEWLADHRLTRGTTEQELEWQLCEFIEFLRTEN